MFKFLKKYKLTTENLAVPEIHTNRAKKDKTDQEKNEIDYNNLAIPEIHIGKIHEDQADKKNK